MSLAGIILKLFSPTIQVQAENINDTDLVTSKAKIFKHLLSLRTPRMLGSLSLFFSMAALLLPLPLTLVLLLVAIIFCAAVLEFGGHLPTWLVVVAIVLLVLAVIAFVILSFSEY
ncbi:hypothetical protein PAXINDRAFT_97543 [Paxillus involutus ATCC 200175]|nr:hypothetical protein PAXINDRAFT_97543 [Paxillus involutus ATCC 200175]